jgi:hypothetical protein
MQLHGWTLANDCTCYALLQQDCSLLLPSHYYYYYCCVPLARCVIISELLQLPNSNSSCNHSTTVCYQLLLLRLPLLPLLPLLLPLCAQQCISSSAQQQLNCCHHRCHPLPQCQHHLGHHPPPSHQPSHHCLTHQAHQPQAH